MKVGQLMNTVVYACRPFDSLERAAQLMWDHDCGVLPIVDGDSKVIGMLTDRDICMAAMTQGRALREILVNIPMATAIVSCRASDSIADVEQRMRESRVRRLPVLDDSGKLIGMIALNDIAREAYREVSGDAEELDTADVGVTLAVIGQPRDPRPRSVRKQS